MPYIRIPVLLVFLLGFGAQGAQSQPPSINQFDFLYSSGYDGRTHNEQGVITYFHTNPWSMGDNLFFIDLSDVGNFENSGNTYIEWGPRLSLGRAFGEGPLSWGLIRDFYLVGEINYLNNKAIESTTTNMGVSFDFGVPGFRVFKLHLLNRNNQSLDGHTQQLSFIWNYPFNVGSQSFTLEGFMDVVGKEGPTHSGLHAQPQFIWKASDRVNFGMEWQYWRNKGGRKGFTESVLQALFRVYL